MVQTKQGASRTLVSKLTVAILVSPKHLDHKIIRTKVDKERVSITYTTHPRHRHHLHKSFEGLAERGMAVGAQMGGIDKSQGSDRKVWLLIGV